MANILVVGNATLDIINEVSSYPYEDDEVRALGQRIEGGGNAANTSVVLAQLGHHVAFAGTLADEPDGKRIRQRLLRHQIDVDGIQLCAGGKVPTSYITLSRETGSRTIVHMRDLPEYSAAHFADIDLDRFDWLHLEGRNIDELTSMIERVNQDKPSLALSLEAEKPRTGMETLFPFCRLLLFSPDYARHRGFDSAEPFLQQMHREHPGIDMSCTWGDAGAWLITQKGEQLHHRAETVTVVDTIGAGDVFNAGLIDGLVTQQSMPVALAEAVELATHKCTQRGLEGVTEKRP